jgi:hypothetical protein
MKVGDPVKIPSKKIGKVLQIQKDNVLVGIGEKFYFNYEETSFPISELKRFYPITEEQQEQSRQILVTDGFELVKKLMNEMLPSESVTVDENSINGYNVSISSTVIEAPRIGAIQEVCGYLVSTWRTIPQTRHEPESVDEIEIGTYFNLSEAATVFACTILKLKCQDYFESQIEFFEEQ